LHRAQAAGIVDRLPFGCKPHDIPAKAVATKNPGREARGLMVLKRL
jgi:hypothetical protein